MTQVKSATGMVWVLGRIYCTGTPDDYKAVHALQDKVTVVPLSASGKPYTPPPGQVDPNFDMKTAVRKQVDGLDVNAYFTRLAQLMKTNPPTAADAPLLARMANIGLVPGQDYDPSKLSGFDKEAIKAVPKLALLKMVKHLKEQKTTNGWLYFTSGVGNWGTDYPLRAMANMLGPGWNRPQDAMYPLSQKDASGDDYNGSDHKYVMHFDKGQFPPVKAFWSITLYDPGLLLRAEPNQSLRIEPAQQVRHQLGRFRGHVSPSRVAGQGEKSQLAAGAERKVRSGDAVVLADGDTAFDPRRKLDSPGREAH